MAVPSLRFIAADTVAAYIAMETEDGDAESESAAAAVIASLAANPGAIPPAVVTYVLRQLVLLKRLTPQLLRAAASPHVLALRLATAELDAFHLRPWGRWFPAVRELGACTGRRPWIHRGTVRVRGWGLVPRDEGSSRDSSVEGGGGRSLRILAVNSSQT